MSQASDTFSNIFKSLKKTRNPPTLFIGFFGQPHSLLLVLIAQKSTIFILRYLNLTEKKYGWVLFFSNLPNVGNITRDLHILMLRHLQSMVFLTLLNTVNNFICCSRQTYPDRFLRHAFTQKQSTLYRAVGTRRQWGNFPLPPPYFGKIRSKTFFIRPWITTCPSPSEF